MTLSEIRKKYLEFYKARGHAVIPSASLVPENDPSTLFTGSGMQPLIPYLLGTPHPEGKRLVNSQKSFRAEDIEEVGDNRHTTFFEMLGNWSLGDYWKQDQLPWLFEFLTEEVELNPKNLYVTVFSGGEGIGRDEEAIGIWKKLFADKKIPAEYAEMNTEEEASEKGMGPNDRIFGYGVKKNWWSRAGMPSKMPAGEPGGPDSEVFYDFGTSHDEKFGKFCHPNCDCGRFMEIGNSVFMEYKKNEDGSFEKLKQRNVDFGGGLERITAAVNNDEDVFNVDIFENAKDKIASLCHVRYEANNANGIVVVGGINNNHGIPVIEMRRSYRVLLDHLRAATFLIADGVVPTKGDRGYVVRNLIRRAVRFADQLKISPGSFGKIAETYVDVYGDYYLNLKESKDVISLSITNEEIDFRKVLDREGPRLKKFVGEAVFNNAPNSVLDPEMVFQFVTAHGVPLDYIKDEAKNFGVSVDETAFQEAFKKHQEISRAGIEQTFKGGLADHSEKVTRLHTAHHLLLKALQIVLGPQVKQRGSNITSERLRMDFSYDGKMTDEQKKEAERIVNEKIAEDLPVVRSELPREEAEKLGAEHEFGQKYPDRVSVYSVGPKGATTEHPQFDKAFSIEFCGGPHVTHTGTIGHFKILKEEASSAGIRRIRGVVEDGPTAG
jgi:alanyl-tRNA synthetase